MKILQISIWYLTSDCFSAINNWLYVGGWCWAFFITKVADEVIRLVDSPHHPHMCATTNRVSAAIFVLRSCFGRGFVLTMFPFLPARFHAIFSFLAVALCSNSSSNSRGMASISTNHNQGICHATVKVHRFFPEARNHSRNSFSSPPP